MLMSKKSKLIYYWKAVKAVKARGIMLRNKRHIHRFMQDEKSRKASPVCKSQGSTSSIPPSMSWAAVDLPSFPHFFVVLMVCLFLYAEECDG
jgi:hypothetical protein